MSFRGVEWSEEVGCSEAHLTRRCKTRLLRADLARFSKTPPKHRLLVTIWMRIFDLISVGNIIIYIIITNNTKSSPAISNIIINNAFTCMDLLRSGHILE